MLVHDFDPVDSDLVTFVNTFQVHGSTEEFERAFVEVAKFLGGQPGFIQYRLSQHVDRHKQDHYVNVALWRDVELWERATAHPDFRLHVKDVRARSTSVGNLYKTRQAFSTK